MNVCDINPHVRFASQLHYVGERNAVKVTDCRIFYTVSGNADICIENQCYQLLPRCLFYCSAGSEYIIHTKEGFTLIAIDFDLTQEHNDQILSFAPCSIRSQWTQMPVYFQHVADSPFLNTHLYLEDAAELYPHLERIVSHFSGNGRYARELTGAALKTLLTELHQWNSSQNPPKIAYIQEYIQQNYAKNLSNQDLAKLVGYHEYYLNRVFLNCTGMSLHNYLIKVRLSHASFLILNTDQDLQSIPELVGFRSYPHFSSYFKKSYGYSPAEYRKRLKGSI